MGLYCPIHAHFLSIWKCSSFKKLGGKKLKTFSLFTPHTQFSLHASKLFLGEFSLCVHFRRNKSQYKTLLPARTIPVLWRERRPDHSAGPQGTELSSLCQVWPCHCLEPVGKLTSPPLRLGFCLLNEEIVVRTEIQWKQQVFLSASQVPGLVPSPGNGQGWDDVVPAVTDYTGQDNVVSVQEGEVQAAVGSCGNRVTLTEGERAASFLFKSDIEVESLKLFRGESGKRVRKTL